MKTSRAGRLIGGRGGHWQRLASGAGRTALLVLIWFALTDGEALWPWGLAIAAGAAAASFWQMPAGRGRFRAMLRALPHAPFLAREAVVSGWDVASRALRPRMSLRPDFIDVELRSDVPRLPMAVAYAVTLMPGTVAITLSPICLHIHALDVRLPNRERVHRLEEQLAPLFTGGQT